MCEDGDAEFEPRVHVPPSSTLFFLAVDFPGGPIQPDMSLFADLIFSTGDIAATTNVVLSVVCLEPNYRRPELLL